MESSSGIEVLPVESLAQVVGDNGLEFRGLRTAIPVSSESTSAVRIGDRKEISILQGQRVVTWHVPSLRALLRGDRLPPSLASPPDEYMLFMFPIEQQVLAFAAATGASASDDDIKDAFSAIRRRPDGRSLGPIHDALWQATALGVGLRPTSPAELDAVMKRLEQSVRRWRRHAGSTGYSEFLRDHLHGER